MTDENSARQDLAALIKDAYYHARDNGGTMHTAADDAADAILGEGWVFGSSLKRELAEAMYLRVMEETRDEWPHFMALPEQARLNWLGNADRIVSRAGQVATR